MMIVNLMDIIILHFGNEEVLLPHFNSEKFVESIF